MRIYFNLVRITKKKLNTFNDALYKVNVTLGRKEVGHILYVKINLKKNLDVRLFRASNDKSS